MWSIDGKESVDIVSLTNNWKQIDTVQVSCFIFKFMPLTQHQIYQIAWYLQDHHIAYDDFGGVIKFINYLSNRDIYFTEIHFRWLKTERWGLRVNFSVFIHWYLPLKLKYINVRKNIKRGLA